MCCCVWCNCVMYGQAWKGKVETNIYRIYIGMLWILLAKPRSDYLWLIYMSKSKEELRGIKKWEEYMLV